MNTGFIIVTNELNDLASCQIGFSGDYRFDGYTVRLFTESKNADNSYRLLYRCSEKPKIIRRLNT